MFTNWFKQSQGKVKQFKPELEALEVRAVPAHALTPEFLPALLVQHLPAVPDAAEGGLVALTAADGSHSRIADDVVLKFSWRDLIP